MAVNHPAEADGVTPGMNLATARVLSAGITAQPFSPARQTKALKALLRWLDRFSPLVAINGDDSLFLDVSGVTHLFGGERVFLNHLTDGIEAFGLCVQTGLASTPGAAWALARYGAPRQITGPGETRQALSALPIAALRLPLETRAKLVRLGLTHIEHLYALPRQALVRRFGVKTATRLDQALGAAPEPISPSRAPAPYIVRLSFDEPIGERSSIEIALSRLSSKLAEKLKRHGKGATALDFTVIKVDGAEQTLSIGLADPSRDQTRIIRLFGEKLDQIDPGFGIEAARLLASRTDTLAGKQIDALGGAAAPDALAKLIDTLGNRLGFDAVTRFAPVERWQPEHSFRRMPASAIPPDASWPKTGAPRPLQLLKRPEPVEVTANPANALSPPIALRRHGVWRMLNHAEGPERIVPEWRSRDPDWPEPRDYWRAEDESGSRLWLFRAGEKWFVHGFFA